MSILKQIITSKKREVVERKKVISIEQLMESGYYELATCSMSEALRESPTGIIAEFKRQSPSKGVIHADAKVAEILPQYVEQGAAAISVLTDQIHFAGSAVDLIEAKKLQLGVPLLRKDFIVDEFQLFEAKALGADAVLLIASVLERQQLLEYSDLAHTLGLEVLLEIHHEEELAYLHPSIDMVGINNRNLNHFSVDVMTSVELCKSIPNHYLKIAESGLSSAKVIKAMKAEGFQGFLIGEYFMKAAKPATVLKQLVTDLL